MAVLNRVYSPLRTQFSMDVVEGTLTQEYDANNKIYTPDRRIRPTAILPVCSITDPSGIIENGVVNRYITDVKWYENGNKDANVISPTSIHYKIDYSSETNNRGRITIYKNVNSDNPITLFFTANYADIVNGKVRRKVAFWGTVVLSSSVSASSPVVLRTETLRGSKYNPLSNLKYMTLSADLYSGNTIIPSAFWWYKKENGQENLITDYVGHNLRELQVPASSLKIGSLNNYVCKVQDCRQNLTDVRNEHLQEELDKIADYPRNLLAKQYFLDLNDEIKPGVVTEGEDADGKYICVPKPSVLRAYAGGTEQRDLFSGKMSFKENTAYVLRVVGKYVSETETQWGFAFIIAYTDGTVSSALRFDYKANKKIEAVHKSTPGKTISHISCTYGVDIPSYIYDIQVTEEYNYNLLEGDTEEVIVTASVSNNNYYKEIQISKVLSVGKKITVKVDGMENLIGESYEYLINLKQGNAIVASGTKLNSSYKIHVFTINDKYDPAGEPVCLILYAGKENATAGNSVKYKNVQLIEGEYAWNVLGEDVEELTVTASESQNQKSDKIEIKNKLQASGKYTIDVGEIINLKGAPESYTVLLYQSEGVNAQVSNSLDLSPSNTTGVFTVNNNYNPELAAYLFFYAGKINATAGNSVQFKNIRLLQGEAVLPSMPDYTPHFIPSAPDIEVESEAIQLPEGYRPSVQGKTINHEFALTSEMPAYNIKVVTPYGDDSGVISIPNNVKLFPAWIQVDVAGIGTLDNPEEYFSADWGNGLKGMNVLLDADDIGLGVQEVEPDVVEGMEHVKYAAEFAEGLSDKLETFADGMRLIVDFPSLNGFYGSGKSVVFSSDKTGFYITRENNNNIQLSILQGEKRKYINYPYNSNLPIRVELLFSSSGTIEAYFNGRIVEGLFSETGNSITSLLRVHLPTSFIELRNNDGTLLHKYDFSGTTISEQLSDKADTANKINLTQAADFNLKPV
nr:MAG TPA: hypothetical protein [Caudoviricetes sp.]